MGRDGNYCAHMPEEELVDTLTECVCGWMNAEWKAKYRAVIARTLRLTAADMPDLRFKNLQTTEPTNDD